MKKKERPNGEPGAIEGGTDFNNVRDPRPTADDRGDVKKTRQAGQLYQDGIHPKDVEQGAIGDCYLVAGLSSLAKADPQAIRDAIRDNGDGSYRVRFYGEDGKAQYVTVDDELYRKGNAGPRYARGTDQKELWPAIMEKGYAKWKGSYETIGDGGQAGKVMSAITGKYSDRVGNAGQSVDALWDRVNGAVEHNRPIATDTHGKDKKYQTNGLVGNHAYSILGTETDGDDRYVVVRNPWASTEYNAGYNTDVDYDKDGKMDGDDGVFRMKVEDFHRLFEHTDMNGAQKPKTMFQRFMGLFG